ncbi:MAG: DUF2330 domain-containing protein [Myxococcota bacterium]
MEQRVRRLAAWTVALGVAMASVGSARAGGAVFGPDGGATPSVEAHRVLTVWHRQRVDVHVQPLVRDADEGFAWLLPVVSPPEVSVGDADVMDAVEAWTRPTVRRLEETGGGCDDTERFAGDPVAGPSVGDLDGTRVGDWTLDTYTGSSGARLVEWLEEGGWAVDEGLEAALQGYLDRDMAFVRATLAPADGDLVEPDPLVLDILEPATGRLPLGIGLTRGSAPETLPVLVHTVADKRYRVENYGGVTLGRVAAEVSARLASGEEAGYDAVVDDLTEEAGGRVFVTEYAMPVAVADAPAELQPLLDGDTAFVTRLYARVPSEVLADPVVTFSKEGPEIAPEVVVRPGDGVVAVGVLFGLLLAFGLARTSAARRERQPGE